MIFDDALQTIKDKVTGGGVKKPADDPAGLFDYSPGTANAVPGGTQVAQSYLMGKQAYGNALAQFNQQRNATAQAFGYQGDIDPNTGVMSNLRVDQTNPYGGYQMDRRAHADQWQALRDQQAGRHIGGHGLGAQAASDARFGWGGEDSQHAQDFIGKLAGYDQGQQQAYQGWQDTYWQALQQATRDAIDQQNYDSSVWDGADGGDGGDTSGGTAPPAAGGPKILPKYASDPNKVQAAAYSTKAAQAALKARNAATAALVKKAAAKPAPKPKPIATVNRSVAVPTKPAPKKKK